MIFIQYFEYQRDTAIFITITKCGFQICFNKVFEKRHEFFKLDHITTEIIQKKLNKKICNYELQKLLAEQFSNESTIIDRNNLYSTVLEFEQDMITFTEKGDY